MIIPRKLQTVIKKHKGKFHPIAKELKVNTFWIHQLITKNIEPKNTDIRARMFLPAKPRKPKRSQPETPDKQQERDLFGTPAYAVDLLLPYLMGGTTIWEPATGHAHLANRLRRNDGDMLYVIETDIQTGVNFLNDIPAHHYDYVITNPPYSLKRKFYERCRELNKPFALLIPADFCGWTLRAMQEGAQWIIPTRRIDYITPTGKSGVDSKAQFHSGWLTYRLNLPMQINIVELTNKMKENI
jgi:hypothetical protein